MLIINADDWGRSRAETEAALACYREKAITSATAMMFMEDAERAAGVAKECGIDIGLHLNLDQAYNGRGASAAAAEAHRRVVRFMKKGAIALVVYHPGLRGSFRDVFVSQMDEFHRLYGRAPSHLDGHHHRHLCANVVFGGFLADGMKIRRNFTFAADQKGGLNRAYRSFIDGRLARHHKLTECFFSLSQALEGKRMAQVAEAARTASVELMAHPVNQPEYDWLMGQGHREMLSGLRAGTYADL